MKCENLHSEIWNLDNVLIWDIMSGNIRKINNNKKYFNK